MYGTCGGNFRIPNLMMLGFVCIGYIHPVLLYGVLNVKKDKTEESYMVDDEIDGGESRISLYPAQTVFGTQEIKIFRDSLRSRG